MDQSSTPGYEFRGFHLDTSLHRLLAPTGHPIPLPSRAYEVLRYLVERPGELVDKTSLMKAVWPKAVVEENNLSQCIFALRKALGETGTQRSFILTIPGRGFKFVAPVRVIPNALPDPTPSAGPPPATPHPARRRWGWPVAAAVLIVALSAGIAIERWHAGPVTLPSEYVQLTDVTDSATAPAISPDGHLLAFIRGGDAFLSSGQIWLKVLPDGEPVQLTSGEAAVFAPTFTPDGTRVAYSAVTQTAAGANWDTLTVPVLGGMPQMLLPNASGLSFIGPHEVVYSEFKEGLHLGIVTSLDDRSRHRDIYFPAHMRGMAHYSYLSPDRKSLLIVEMNGVNQFVRCRLVPFDGSSAGQEVGPDGACLSASWSGDGKWMYFAATVRGQSHLWRQRSPDGAAEQITFGPTQEQTVAPGADGHSLLTSIGLTQTSLWMHDAGGEHRLTTESYALLPHLSADARRVYFLSAPAAGDPPELWRLDIASGHKEPLVRGFDIRDYAISADERQAVFSDSDKSGPRIWQVPLDRTAAPRLLVRGADEVKLDRMGNVYYRGIGAQANYLYRLAPNDRVPYRLLDTAILNVFGVSPDGRWICVGLPRKDGEMATWLVPAGPGERRLLGNGWWAMRWSPDGHLLYVEDGMSASELTLVIPTDAEGLPSMPISEALRSGMTEPITHWGDSLAVSSSPKTYVFVRSEQQRNVYRVPLHD